MSQGGEQGSRTHPWIWNGDISQAWMSPPGFRGGGGIQDKIIKSILHWNFSHIHFLTHARTAQGNADFLAIFPELEQVRQILKNH